MLTGVLIKESLEDTSVIGSLAVTGTTVETVDNAAMNQPDTWTLITFEVAEGKEVEVAKMLGKALKIGTWYVSFKNEQWVWVVFADCAFYYKTGDATGKEVVVLHAKSLGIPKSQMDW